MDETKKTRLKKVILKHKLVSQSHLEKLLYENSDDMNRLLSTLRKKKIATEAQLLNVLSEFYGVPAVNLFELEIRLEILDIIPYDIAKKTVIMPLSATAESMHLAMANPDDVRVIEEVEFVSGTRVFPYVAMQDQILSTIQACYSARGEGRQVYCATPRGPVSAVPPPPIEDPNSAESTLELDVDPNSIRPASLEEASFGPQQKTFDDAPPSTLEKQAPRQEGLNTILVVDDDSDILTLISRVLKEMGYCVITASRGFEALQKLKTEKIDMIILDAMLPEVHGFDICRKIKGSPKYKVIPVIMISAVYRGWRYAKDIKESYGVDDFIEKPFKIEELVKLVDKHARGVTNDSDLSYNELSHDSKQTLIACTEAYRAGEIDKAISLLEKSIEIEPLAYKLRYQLGLLLGKNGEYYRAIQELENALDLRPDDFPALKNLAVLYQKTAFTLKAIETWERALEHAPDDATRESIKTRLMSLL